ncbi:MAG: glycoside hydrolase family 13 protein [Bacteroidetes bacterium]|nr:glycoside hydrolase family 13 protein [Bacteroidota bacterium]
MKTFFNFLKSAAIVVALFISLNILAQKSPERVEPPFWWAGMYHSELQLLVYAEDIGSTRLELTGKGVKVKEVIAVESPNYLFVYLDISNATAGKFEMKFSKLNEVVYKCEYELKEREEGSAYRLGFNATDAIYLLMPDRFSNGDLSNDNIDWMMEKSNRSNADGRHGGDIQGIINNLDYIKDLGFTAIWHNPVIENNQPQYTYHGYAITDFYKVDERLGTNEDYKRLVAEADKKGISIIKDMIFNHCGLYHWWMKDLPTNDWVHQWGDYTRTTYRGTTIVDPHVAQADLDLMLKGWFDRWMPDLNQRNRILAKYLIQNSVWWVEYSGINGIRMDTQPYPYKDFMADWAEYVMLEYPNFTIVGEAWLPYPSLVSYYQGGALNFDGYNSYLPSVFDFPLYYAITEAFNEKDSWDTGLIKLYNSISQDFLYPNPYELVVFGDNHDVDRLFTSLKEDPRKLKLALTFIFTTRGIPMMYSGTEILMSGIEHKGHGLMRKDFPGGWPADPVNAFTKKGRNSQQNEMWDHISKLLNYRKVKEVLHYGWLKHFVPQENIYVYFRYNDNETVMVIINSNEKNMELDMTRFAEATNGFSGAKDIITGKTFEGFKKWNIPAMTPMVLELK